MATEPRLDKSIDKIVVVDNIPKVGQDKKEKLKQILNKLLQNYGTIVNQYFPEENGVTKGFVLNKSAFSSIYLTISLSHAQLHVR